MIYGRFLTLVAALVLVNTISVGSAHAQRRAAPRRTVVSDKPLRLKLGASSMTGSLALQGTYDLRPQSTARSWTPALFLDFTGESIGAGIEGRFPFTESRQGDYFYGAVGAGLYSAQSGHEDHGYGRSGPAVRAYLGYEFSHSYMVELGLIDTSFLRVGMRF